MTDLDKLKKAFEDVIWMAARYAHGRSTYAPSMVRGAVNAVKEIYPDWTLAPDQTIKPLDRLEMMSKSDDLTDIYSTVNDK